VRPWCSDAREGEIETVQTDDLPFRFLAQSLPTPCWISDADGEIVWVNDAWVTYTGLTVEGIQGVGLGAIHDPAILPEVRRVWAATKARAAPGQMIFPLKGRDGQFRQFHTRVVPIFDAGGRIRRWFGTNTDVTEHTETEARLRSSEEQLKEIFDAAADAFLIVDQAGRLIDANRAASQLFGHSQAELLALTVADILPSDQILRWESLAGRAREYTIKGEWRLRRGDGSWVDVESDTRLLGDGRRLAILRDITERKRAHERLSASEAQFRELANRAPVMIWETDPDGAASFLNQRLRDFHGLGPDAPLPLLEDVAHPEDAPMIRASYAAAASRGEPFSHLARLMRQDGECRWIRTEAAPKWDERGRLAGYVGCMVDVTEARLADTILRAEQERLQRQVGEETTRAEAAERQLRRFWDASRDLFVIVDLSDGLPRAINARAWRRTLGYSAEEIMGRRLMELVHPDDRNATLNLDAEGVLSGGGPVFGFENRYRHADGRWVWLSWNVVREGGASYCIARDITEEKARAEHTARAQRLEAIGQLTGGVAHDFNNLLTTILGSLDLMQRRPDDKALRDRLTMAALGAVRRGERLNNRLLSFARGQTDGSSAADVRQLLLNIKPLLESALGETSGLGLELAADVRGCAVEAAELEAAILNLVVNARDAMPEGGTVTIRTRPASGAELALHGLEPGDYSVLEVIDTGQGMPPEVLAHAFEPFFTTKGVGKSVGLGLAQVYGVARRAGGTATVDSYVGGGTIVRLYLRRAALLKADEATVESSATTGERVLLVEDDPLVAVVTETLLADLGYEVTRQGNAAEALEALQREPFDILFTDVRMPGGMNGVDLAKAATHERPGLKILLCSAWAGVSLEDEGAGAAWRFLAKPFDRPQLRKALNDLDTIRP
jgi:PAS domain S-box-containing protein